MPAPAYEEYRRAKLESGKLFQDFVVDVAWNLLGLAIVQYSSIVYQRTVGESKTGVEIKHDEQFARTRNLWIEIAEKARPRDGPYVASGIYRADNTWLYFIGDYDTIFIFPKKWLVGLHMSGKYMVRENNTQTSQGFLLREQQAESLAVNIVRPNAADAVRRVVGDLKLLGETLHNAAKREQLENKWKQLGQFDLFAR